MSTTLCAAFSVYHFETTVPHLDKQLLTTSLHHLFLLLFILYASLFTSSPRAVPLQAQIPFSPTTGSPPPPGVFHAPWTPRNLRIFSRAKFFDKNGAEVFIPDSKSRELDFIFPIASQLNILWRPRGLEFDLYWETL